MHSKMKSLSTQMRFSIVLGIYSVLFPLCSCAPDKTLYGAFDMDLGRYTRRPFVLPTFKPWEPWKKFTLPPYDFKNYKSSEDTTIKVIVFVPVLIAIVIGILCKYLVCGDNESESTYISNTTLHPPPRPPLTTASRSRTEIAGVHVPASHDTTQGNHLFFTHLRVELFPPVNVSLHDTNSNSGKNEIPSGDKPPDYASVVNSDLPGGIAKFPSVTDENNGDSPPPSYDEKNWPKY